MPFQNDSGCKTCSIDTASCSTDHLGPAHSYSTSACNPDMNGNYKVEDYLLPMVGKLLPMHRTFIAQYPSIAQFLFDYYEVPNPADGSPVPRLTFKNIPNVQYAPFYDANFVTRGEWNFKPVDFYVRADVDPASLTIPIRNAAGAPSLGADYQSGGSGSLGVGDTVLIYRNDPATPNDCCNQVIQKTIVAIDTVNNTITIEGATPFTFTAGDKVKRMFRSRNDADAITNTFGIIPNTSKRSYLQHFGYKVIFKKGELNMAYASENGVKDFIANRMYHGNLNMLRELAFATYRGRNRGNVYQYGSVVSNQSQPAETQGIITGIFDSNARLPELELVNSMHNMISDDDKVRHILTSILKTQNSGMAGKGSVVTMICNEVALTSLMKMNNAWNKFTGLTITKTDNVTKDFTLPVIQTPNGRTEIMQCSILSELYPDEGVIIYGYKDLVGAKTRENQMIQIDNGGVIKASLGFNFEDVTIKGQQGVGHEVHLYDIFTEFAQTVVGLDQGARRMDMGLLC